MQEKAQEIADYAERTVEVLSGDRQALWSVLRLSIMTRFEYFCQLSPPSLSEPVAAGLDDRLWGVLEAAVGFSVPKGEAGDVVSCPAGELDGRSYQGVAAQAPCQAAWLGLQEPCGHLWPCLPGCPGDCHPLHDW